MILETKWHINSERGLRKKERNRLSKKQIDEKIKKVF